MIDTQDVKCKQVKTQYANCQNENIIINKSTICQALPSWKMLNLHLIFEIPPNGICGMRQDLTIFFYIYMHALSSSPLSRLNGGYEQKL